VKAAETAGAGVVDMGDDSVVAQLGLGGRVADQGRATPPGFENTRAGSAKEERGREGPKPTIRTENLEAGAGDGRRPGHYPISTVNSTRRRAEGGGS